MNGVSTVLRLGQDENVEIVRKDKCDGTTRDLSKIDKYLELVEYIKPQHSIPNPDTIGRSSASTIKRCVSYALSYPV